MNSELLFQQIQNSALSQQLGQLDSVYGIFAQFFHIAGLVLLLSSVLLVNLRLLGLGLHQQSVRLLVKATNPLIGYGLLSLLLSGLFMLLPSAALYQPNPAFWLKMALLGPAILVQLTLYRYVTAAAAPSRWLVWFSVVCSLLLWFGVALAGRAIGFVAA